MECPRFPKSIPRDRTGQVDRLCHRRVASVLKSPILEQAIMELMLPTQSDLCSHCSTLFSRSHRITAVSFHRDSTVPSCEHYALPLHRSRRKRKATAHSSSSHRTSCLVTGEQLDLPISRVRTGSRKVPRTTVDSF